MIKVFEAFSGYGSQSLALKKYGVNFECVGISEIDKYAIQAHEALHGLIKNYGDITKINPFDLPDMNLLTYSFPCQDISMAGKQRGLAEGTETRSSLLWECQKIIEIKRPKYLMMENVKALVSKKFKSDFYRWLEVLENLGYTSYWKVINAKNCGVPQNRERVFCISILKEYDNFNFNFYDDFVSGIRLKDILEHCVDEKYYLSDKMVKGLVEKSPQIGYINQDTQASKVISDTEQFQTLCSGTHGYANGYIKEYSNPSMIEMAKSSKNADSNDCLTTIKKDTLLLERTGFEQRSDEGVRFFKDNVIGTLTTKDSGGNKRVLEEYKTQFRIRKLTPRECFRLMGMFDSDIDKIQATGISNSQQYKMAGNSIVVDCMKFLEQLI